jgi:hypothetical protein
LGDQFVIKSKLERSLMKFTQFILQFHVIKKVTGRSRQQLIYFFLFSNTYISIWILNPDLFKTPASRYGSNCMLHDTFVEHCQWWLFRPPFSFVVQDNITSIIFEAEKYSNQCWVVIYTLNLKAYNIWNYFTMFFFFACALSQLSRTTKLA